MCSQENINLKAEDNNDKKTNVLGGETTENIYYSWKKKHEANLINDSRKNSAKKFQSLSLHSHNNAN